MMWMRDRLGAMFRHKRGNVATIVALLAVPLVTAIGGGIDFANVNKIHTQLQDAADAAVLAAAWSQDKSETGMKTVADQVLAQNIASMNLGTVNTLLSKAEYNSTSVLTYKTTVAVPTFFLGLIGMDDIPVTTIAKSDATVRNTEIAFVLDSTGSMASSSKMTNLKSSVDAMLAGLLDAEGLNSAETKVAVIPFDTQVKIAASTSLSYIDYGTATNSEACASGISSYLCKVLIDTYDKICINAIDPLTCKGRVKMYYKTYTSNGRTYYETKFLSYEGSGSTYTIYSYAEVFYTYSSNGTTYEVMSSQGGLATSASSLTAYNASQSGYTSLALTKLTYPVSYVNGYDGRAAQTYTVSSYDVLKRVDLPAITSNRSAWLGCVSDRTQPYDVSADTASAGTADSLYPARPCGSSTLQSAMGLTTDIAAARAKVQSLQPAGNTNITIGMQWGMEMLSPSAPFTGGSEWKTPLYTKYIILVTDGDNTQNRWTSSQSEIDARTALVCQAAKDKGIVVYTVRVMAGNSTLLRNCATQSSFFYDLSTASQLSTTMTDILKSIRKIRLSQ